MDRTAPVPLARAPARRRSRPAGLTGEDRLALGFMTDHGAVVADQVAELLAVSPLAASRRLADLRRGGYVSSEHDPPCHRVRAKGRRAIGSGLGQVKISAESIEHTVGLGWVALAARAGLWGELSEIVPERRMRSADGSSQRESERMQEREPEPFGVRLGGFGPGGRERLHYPDLVLVTARGQRVAVELELTQKSRRRIEGILGGYALDRRIDAVLYLVEDRGAGPRIARAVEEAARRYGISEMVHVQRFQRVAPAPRGRGRAAERAGALVATRSPGARTGERGRDAGAER